MASSTASWKTVGDLHDAWWKQRIARQSEIDASIAARADVEYLYDKPYTDPARVRVAGPFTVESLSPHRVLPASEQELIETIDAADGARSAADADLAGADFCRDRHRLSKDRGRQAAGQGRPDHL